MNCREVEEQDVPERYALGRLTDSERDEFEQHYFECDSCFSQLQTALALQEELRHQPRVRTQAGGTSLRRMWFWAPASAALALFLVVGVWWYAGRKQQFAPQATSSTPVVKPETSGQLASSAAPSLEELARVQPPAYSPVVLRGAEDEAHESFRKAMQHYLKNDYTGAIPGLRAAVKANPDTASFHFYLGACYLLTNQSDWAIKSFRKTISLENSTYSGQAHFYLAKAYLQEKDVSAAERELQATVPLDGGNAAEAREILHQLRK